MAQTATQVKLEYKNQISLVVCGLSFSEAYKPQRLEPSILQELRMTIDKFDKDTHGGFFICGFDKNSEYTLKRVGTGGFNEYNRSPVATQGSGSDIAELVMNNKLQKYQQKGEIDLCKGTRIVIEDSLGSRGNIGVGGIGNLVILDNENITEVQQAGVALMHNIVNLEKMGYVEPETTAQVIKSVIEGKEADSALGTVNLAYQKIGQELLTNRVL